jgi:hypothetical protein
LVPADPVDLGVVDFKAGVNMLGLDVTGKNDHSSNISVGLDYIKLVPAS